MASYDSADLLARLRTQLRRPSTDETLTDAQGYQALTDAQNAIYEDVFTRSPDSMTGALVALTSLDGGYTFPFGTDANGDAIEPLGHVGIYTSPNAVADCAWQLNQDYLNEGTRIRIPNGRTYSGTLYWRGVLPPAAISASSPPSLTPASSRVLIVYWAAAEYAGWGDLKDATSYRNKYTEGLGRLLLRLKTQFRLGPSYTPLLNFGGGVGGSGGPPFPRLPWINISDAPYNADAAGLLDATAAITAAIAAAPEGTWLIGNPGATYLVGAVPLITKPITIDFGMSYLKPNTTGIMFQYALSNPDLRANRLRLNANFVQGSVHPTDLIKLLKGGINPEINITVQGTAGQIIATHSLVWNYASYGLRARILARNTGTLDCAVYCSHDTADPDIFSNDIDIDCDISNFNGHGVHLEGCVRMNVHGTIEGCVLAGGIAKAVYHDNHSVCGQLNLLGIYTEVNDGDIQLADGDFLIEGCRLGTQANPDHVIMGSGSKIVSNANQFYSGGFAGVAPTSLVDTGSEQRTSAAGYTGIYGVDAIIKDTIRGGFKFISINPQGKMPQVDVTAGSTGTLITAQPLSGTAYDSWRVVASNSLPQQIRDVYRVFVSRQNTTIVGIVLNDFQERENLVLNVAPGGTGWGVGDIITGAAFGSTAEIVAKTDTTHYAIRNRTGVFPLTDTLTNGVNAAAQTGAFPTTATTTGSSHSSVSVVDLGTGKYDIRVKNLGPITTSYWTTFIENTRLLP